MTLGLSVQILLTQATAKGSQEERGEGGPGNRKEKHSFELQDRAESIYTGFN